ncbi:MAG: hypothetical protein QXT19_00295 [Candidatus Woesearchaeota archaeon]
MNPQEAYKKLVLMYSSRLNILLFEIQKLRYDVGTREPMLSDKKVAKALMLDYKTLRERVRRYSRLIAQEQESSTLPFPA